MITTINNLPAYETRLILEWVNESKNAAICKSWRAARELSVAMLMNGDQGYFHSKILHPFLPSSAPPSTYPEQMRFMAEVIKNVRAYCELTPNTAPPILSARKPIETAVLEEIVTRVSAERSEQDLITFMNKVNSELPPDQQFRPSSPGLTNAQIGDEIRLFFQNSSTAIQRITTLSLISSNLFSLPPEIGLLVNLKSLNVPYNHLTFLPPEMGQLGSLQRLDVFNNHIISLPPEIRQLGSLQELYVVNNRLNALPPEIGQLGNLTELNVSKNHIITLPSEIRQLGNLHRLFVNNNNLTSLPPEIGQLVDLEELDVSDNHLTTLPPEIGRLNHLFRLDLSHNPVIANTQTWYNRILSVLYQSPTGKIIKTFRQDHPNCRIIL